MNFLWDFIISVLYLEIGLVLLFVLPIFSPQTWKQIFSSRVVTFVKNTLSILSVVSVAIGFIPIENDGVMYHPIIIIKARENFQQICVIFFSILYLLFVLWRLKIMIDTQALTIIEKETLLLRVSDLNKQIQSLQELQKKSVKKIMVVIKEAEQDKELASKSKQDLQNLMTNERKTHDAIVDSLNKVIFGFLVKQN